MGFGRYRFRRSFGNVNSQFRGARFDTYPLRPYPTEGLVLDLAAFTYTETEVQDKSGEGNVAVLYSGRGVNLAGADYVELPDVGATKSITVLVRSSTDTFIYATDDATQTEDAINIITADGTWQEVILTFPNAISGKIRLGTIGAGPSFFSGDLANARCRDASDNLLDQFFLNEHTDVAAGGLDGLPCVGRNGNVGQYVDCAAAVQIPGDVGGLTPPQVLGMDFNQYRWFNGVDTFVTDSTTLAASPTLDYTFHALIESTSNQGLLNIGGGSFVVDIFSGNWRFFGRNTSAATVGITSSTALASEGLFKVRVVFDGSDWSIYLDDLLAESKTQSATIQTLTGSAALGFRSGSGYFKGLIFNGTMLISGNPEIDFKGYGKDPWDGGTETGTFENVLIPESLNKGLDAFGNEIEELRSSTTMNADGSGSSVTADDDSLDVTNALTIILKPDLRIPDSFTYLVSKWDSAANQRAYAVAQYGVDGDIRVLLSSDGSSATYDARYTYDSEIVDLALVYNGVTARLVADGNDLTPSSVSGSVPASLFNSSAPLRLLSTGGAAATGGISPTPLSDVKIYNRALTDEEIAQFS